jgi:UDP-N-acetylmuramoylalanine--D-glutamate ligase
MKSKKLFHGVRVLVMGLGLHGGGVATVKWFAREGAIVTATDLRSREVLAPSIKALKGVPVILVLGEHREQDFVSHDVVMVNPGVPKESPFLALARKSGARIENDASIFFRYSNRPSIAVTGTRGKSTTTAWIAQLLQSRFPEVRPSGNTPDNAFLAELSRVRGSQLPVVAEMSSWQLELLPVSESAPHIAVITNLYPDHLNRYSDITEYARAKANIFEHQSASDHLILQAQDTWTPFYESLRPKGRVWYVSQKTLPKGKNGLFVRGGDMIFRDEERDVVMCAISRFQSERGVHNLLNAAQAVLAVHLLDPNMRITERKLRALVAPRMRQEVIAKKGRITVVNDSCATSPDGVLAALKRFSPQGHLVLILGGTDKSLEFGDLARTIDRSTASQHIILLEGSATTKLRAHSRRLRHVEPLPTLLACVESAFRVARSLRGPVIILFSPGAASFEKFLHEFDRGEQFNSLVEGCFATRATSALK